MIERTVTRWSLVDGEAGEELVELRVGLLDDAAGAVEAEDLRRALEGGEHHADAPVLLEVGDGLDAAAEHVGVGEAERAGDAEHARAALGRDVDVAAVAARRRGHEEDVLAFDERAEGVVDRVEHLGHAAQDRAAPPWPAAPRGAVGYGFTFSRSCCACSSASWASSGTFGVVLDVLDRVLRGVRGVLLEVLGALLDLVGGLLGGLRAVLDLLGGLLRVLLQLLALVLELLGVLLELLGVGVSTAGGEAEGADDEEGGEGATGSEHCVGPFGGAWG